MLKLAIHAGLHKTGTSTFQHICRKFADYLLANKVYYQTHEKIGPKVRMRYAGTPQHSYLVWELQKHNIEELRSLLINGKTALNNDGMILISGEDFENCLVDHEMARAVEHTAQEVGIDAIEWIFVHRPPFDYFKSLYAEMSKHHVVINFCQTAKSVLRDGFFRASVPNFNYLFVFDYKKFFDAFRKQTKATVSTIEYEHFCNVFPGYVVLQDISAKTIQLDYIKNQIDLGARLNTRDSSAKVEFNYLRTKYNIKVSDGFYQTYSRMINLLLKPRLIILRLCEAKIKRDFATAFSDK